MTSRRDSAGHPYGRERESGAGSNRDAWPIEFTVEGLVVHFADGEVAAVDPFAVRVDLTDEQVRQRPPAPVPSDYETKPLVDVKEKAHLLGVDAATIYRHAEELGGEKVGGVWRFPRDQRTGGADPEGGKPGPARSSRRKGNLGGRVRVLKIRGNGPAGGV